MKSVVLLILFIVTAGFLTKSDRNGNYRQESIDVYLGKINKETSAKALKKIPKIKVLKKNMEGAFEIVLKDLSRHPEVPRSLKKYFRKALKFDLAQSSPCRFIKKSNKLVNCVTIKEGKSLAYVKSQRRKVELLSLTSGIFSGDLPDSKGKMETTEFYMMNISLRIPSLKKDIKLQFVTSPESVVRTTGSSQLIAKK